VDGGPGGRGRRVALSRRAAGAVVALIAGLVGATAVRLLAARPRPSDEDQIRSLFSDAALAVEQKRVSDAVAAASERFAGDGLDKRELKRLIASQVLRGEWVSVTVAGSRVRAQGDVAEAVVDVVMARSGPGRLADLAPADASASRITCRLEREEGSWRVVAAARRPLSLPEVLTGPPP
jgi:hypothetical protein